MTFIEAIIKINSNPNFELCDDENELNGIHNCICIYKNGEFVGKLRWATNENPASVDEELEKSIDRGDINELLVDIGLSLGTR